MSQDESVSGEGPEVRSLSMSQNMAFSVVEEVPHMIRLHPPGESSISSKSEGWGLSSNDPQRSSYSTSLRNSRKLSCSAEDLGSNKTLKRGSDSEDSENVPVHRSQVQLSKSVQAISSESQSLSAVVKGRRNGLLVGIVVSRWDNIVGPQSVYLWTEELTSVFYPGNLPTQLARLVKYVTDHTVDHQTATGRYIHPSVQRTALCIVPDLNLAYLSLSIRVPNELDAILEFQTSDPMTENSPDNPALTMPHSVSVLYNLKYFDQFLLLRPLVVSWLLEFGPQIGVLLCKDNLQSSLINSWCAELCKSITAIQTCWAQDISDSGSTDSNSNESGFSDRNSKIGRASATAFQSDFSYLPPNTAAVPKAALETVLTSHLSTFGSSIIVGNDCLLINQIIRFLLCFSTTEESYCSRYSLSTLPDTFMKGLYVQGLILGGIGEKSISYKQVTTNRLPLTKIELGSKVKVRQTPVTSFIQEKEVVIMQELNKLWTSSVVAVQSQETFPNIVKDTAGFINRFIIELELLPPERRYGRLLLFRRALHAKAMSLISFLSSIQYKPYKEKLKLKQLIPQILGFDNSEYLIVQVTAEKIRPGVMTFVAS